MKKLKIGFLGDGQLAKMSAEAAVKLGFEVLFLGKNPLECCAGIGRFMTGDIFNSQDVSNFSKEADIVTLENEFIPLDVLGKTRRNLFPTLESFEKIENKIIEKKTARSLDLPVGAYEVFEDIQKVEFHGPMMLKLSKGGYDGYGNFLIKSKEDLEKLKSSPSSAKIKGELIGEELISFDREVAVTLARSTSGEVALYPVVDTIQKNNMCSRVIAPSNLSDDIKETIQELSVRFVKGLNYVGVMSLEFFVMENGQVFFNESSPRPHNSGHYTMDASETSQFENHIRAITGMPLGKTGMASGQAVMLNILGRQNGPAVLQGFEKFPQAKFHMYNKSQSKIGRKMGHVNLLGNDRKKLLELSDILEKEVGA